MISRMMMMRSVPSPMYMVVAYPARGLSTLRASTVVAVLHA
jgi:hypothetical protein